MELPPQTARVGLAEGDPGIIPPFITPAVGRTKEESSRRNLQKPVEMEICNYLGGWDTRHGWEYKGIPFPLDGIPFPCPGEGAPKFSTMAAPGWVIWVAQSDRRPVGSSGSPQGRASSLRAEVAGVKEVSYQATLGLCHPLLTGGGHNDKEEMAQDSPLSGRGAS